MGGFSFARIWEVIAHASAVWIGLWIGLALLTVALLVLMCTSWGHSNPLNKCAALSVLAHLLLAGYATTVQIVSTGAAATEPGGFRLALLDTGGSGSADDAASGPARWEKFSPQAISVPQIGAVERTPASPMADAPALSPSAAPALPDNVTPTADAALPMPSIASPAPLTSQRTPGAQVEPIDTASMSGPEKAAAPLPQMTSAERAPPSVTPVKTPVIPMVSAPMTPLGDMAATLPELPTPTASIPADALADLGNLPFRAAALPQQPTNAASSNVEPATGSSAKLTAAVSTAGVSGAANRAVPQASPQLATAAANIPAAAMPSIYKDRVAKDREGVLESRGGSAAGEASVQAALKWLAGIQSPDGHWDAAANGAGKETSTGGQDRHGAGARADTGVTGLALLAMLGAGNTHLNGAYVVNVQHGLEYLLSVQGRDGNLGGGAETYSFMYCHGIATFALSEAYAMTKDPRLEKPLRNAINYSIACQHPSTGGWRYQTHETGDTSQLGWQLMALKSADMAGLEMPSRTREGVLRFLRSVSSGHDGGLASYRPGERASRAMTAEAIVCRQFLGLARDNPANDEAGDYLLADLPNTQKPNIYYWYYGTLAMYELQGEHWRRWNEALQATLIKQQQTSGDTVGSWDPDPTWGGYGGRVYSTSMSTLCLEVYYRFLPIYGSSPSNQLTKQHPGTTEK